MLMYYQRDYTEFRHVFASRCALAPPDYQLIFHTNLTNRTKAFIYSHAELPQNLAEDAWLRARRPPDYLQVLSTEIKLITLFFASCYALAVLRDGTLHATH